MNELISIAIQNTVVALALSIVIWWVVRVWKNPLVAHLLWLLVLVKLVSPPLVRIDLPGWPSRQAPAEINLTIGERSNANDAEINPDPLPDDPNAEPDQAKSAIVARPPVPNATETLGDRRSDVSLPKTWGNVRFVLVYAWIAGIGFIVLTTVIRMIRFQRMLAGTLPASARMQRMAAELAAHMGLNTHADLRVAEGSSTPLVWFIGRRPVILLPLHLLVELDEFQVMMVLTHELAHLRRRDHWVRMFEFLVSAVYWWNPLVWWVRRELHQAEEQSCDAWVSWMFPERACVYAETLFKAASLIPAQPSLAMASPFLNPQTLKTRIEMVLRGEASRIVSGRSLLLLALVAAAVMPVGVQSQDAPKRRDLRAAPTKASLESAPAAPQPVDRSAAQLVQKVYDDEAWLDSATSVLIRMQSRQIWTDEERQWVAKNPNNGFGVQKKSDGLTDYLINEDWAWDATRIHHKTEIRNLDDNSFNHSSTVIWDGKLAAECDKMPNFDHYVLGNKAGQFFTHRPESSLISPWGMAGAHRFWWWPADLEKYRNSRYLNPTDFERVGVEDVNGVKCDVVESRAGRKRMWIGVADGRLHRQAWSIVEYKNPNHLELFQKIGGPKIKTTFHWQPWLDSLEPSERRRAERELALAQAEISRPWVVYKMEDYREIAPGHWFPFRRIKQDYNTQSPEPFVNVRIVETVEEFAINRPLADDLFEIKLVDGVQVGTDWRYDPPIRYTYNHAQPESERLALRDKAREENANAEKGMQRREEKIKSRLGENPPPLPTSGWLNGAAPSWADLRGKVVVLHFWDVGCRPCQNELPIVQNWNEHSKDSGIVVIGIHRNTVNPDAVRKKMDEFGLTYPVLVDPADPEFGKGNAASVGGEGQLHQWFGSTWWPHTVVINKKGVIAAHGQLFMGDIAKKIRELAAESD